MALNLVKPLQGRPKVTRGFAAHVKDNPNTWHGIDYAVPTGTPLIACDDGYISHSVKDTKGGGYSFILNFNKYPGWMVWYAHCSQIPPNGAKFKRGQVIGKSGVTGFATGPHLHFSILHQEGKYFVPKDPDNINVVKWEKEVDMLDTETVTWLYRVFFGREPDAGGLKTWTSVPAKQAIKALYTSQERKNVVAAQKKLTTDLTTLRTQLTKLEEAAKTAQAIVGGLQGRVTDLEKDLVAKDKEITELKQQLAMPASGVEKPAIPRVTKNDNWFSTLLKRLQQKLF